MRLHSYCVLLFFLSWTVPVQGADWPMWRFDATRSAASDEELRLELHLVWERLYSSRTMVWDDPLNQDLMPYDKVFEPVVSGNRMFIGFNDCDKLVAVDTDTGEQLWAFYTDGPVRLPPAAWHDRVYFTSDDGYLYCLHAADGSLIWKFRGGLSERKIIGNKRLISTWPARGGPVISDGTVYFAASIWPMMGTFIYALDAATGEVKWENDRTGSQYMLQPHNSPAFAGVAPQGALGATEKGLLVPGGRSVPAFFERASGEQRYFHLAAQNKTGGSFVCAGEHVFFNHHRDQVCSMYDLETGYSLVRRIGMYPVLTEQAFYISGKTIRAYDAAQIQQKARWWLTGNFLERWLGRMRSRKIKPEFIKKILDWWIERKSRIWQESLLWEIEVDGTFDLIKAGSCLYAAGKSGITAIKLPQIKDEQPKIAWSKSVDGELGRLLAADGKLFAVTLDGRILAFGSEKREPVRIASNLTISKPSAQATGKALSIIRQTGVKDGYALVYGINDGSFLEALACNSELAIVAVEEDSAKIDKIRRSLDKRDLYGERIALHRGSVSTFQCPPYMASLTVVNEPEESNIKKIIRSMRPYGGKAWLNAPASKKGVFSQAIHEAQLTGIQIASIGKSIVLTREGPLAGSAAWTHQYGNIANTVKSDDKLVKLPLGILWFGGNSNLDVLPRHGHGPPEQVVGGRLFIEGMDCLSARDVYTGRVLWKVELNGLGNYGVYYDDTYQDAPTSTAYNQVHIPGANIRGTNFVATVEKVYVVRENGCQVLDAATGETVMLIPLPAADGLDKPEWGYIGIYEDYLIAGCGFVKFSSSIPEDSEHAKTLAKFSPRDRQRKLPFLNYDKSASKRLVVMDRHTGESLWSFEADYGFLHNAVCAARGRVFCLDKLPPYIEKQLRRRGSSHPQGYRLLAIDITTGDILWEKNEGVFGTWLSFSEKHDILLQSTRPSRDMVRGEDGVWMAAYSGSDGKLLWHRLVEYSSVPILHGDRIITRGKMLSLLSGEPQYREHPLTGERILLSWKRNYGCNYPIASENLITFRSAAAGFYDLVGNSGTGNMGGFKSGCTSNLIAADGVLNAPDYTRTCACSYQNQTSLAMVYDPDVEIWTFNDIDRGLWPVKRVGINFGAPGDRIAENGTLWLDYPSRGGPSPDIPVKVSGENVKWFCHHSSRIEGDGLKWVAASGVRGLSGVTLTLAENPMGNKPYTVRLYFAECKMNGSKSRVFSVAIQGQTVLENFNIAAEAGKSQSIVVKEFREIPVDKDLTVSFPSSGLPEKGEPLICGIQIIAEGW